MPHLDLELIQVMRNALGEVMTRVPSEHSTMSIKTYLAECIRSGEGQFIPLGHIRHFRDDQGSARSLLFIPEFISTEHAMDQLFSFGPFAHSYETSALKIENLHGQSDP